MTGEVWLREVDDRGRETGVRFRVLETGLGWLDEWQRTWRRASKGKWERADARSPMRAAEVDSPFQRRAGLCRKCRRIG